jgi:phosphatidylglycerophosphatase C
MNIYDFDGTIYDGDSTVDFYLYCLKHYFKVWLALPGAILGALLFLFGIIKRTNFKQRFFSFVRHLSCVDDIVAAFWRENERKIKLWYLAQKQDTDIIISASPEFLLQPICDKLGVSLIASRVDRHTGFFLAKIAAGKKRYAV